MYFKSRALSLVAALSALSMNAVADQFTRFPGCPDKACILPPTSAEMLLGAKFDVRVEIHEEAKAPGGVAGKPNPNFEISIAKVHLNDDGKVIQESKPVPLEQYLRLEPAPLESWNFTYFQDAAHFWKGQGGAVENADHTHNGGVSSASTPVNVVSKVWRRASFRHSGDFKVTVKYNNGEKTEALWKVRKSQFKKRIAKNAIFFIGDGMTTPMISAARVISRKNVNGKYQKWMQMDRMEEMGHVIPCGLDALITDSANSASAYNTGHKSSVNGLGVYADTSDDPFDDPKQELLAELLRRREKKQGGPAAIGVVTTAEVQDATPAAVVSHTRRRGTKAEITDFFIHGVKNFSVPVRPDVLLGGGGSYFLPGKSLNKANYYDIFRKEGGYNVVHSKTDLLKHNNKDPLLGIFHKGNMDVWLDRNVYKDNLKGKKSSPLGDGSDALDQPNLVDMTITALNTLKKRGGNGGFFAMIEAASIDKMMHPLDFHRGLADLLELDNAVKAALEWVKKNDPDTLVVVTADHGHGFDVYGTVDTEFFNAAPDNDESGTQIEKRGAIGIYETAGWPGYKDEDGDGFPDNWTPRVTLAAGTVNFPNYHETFQLNTTRVKNPAILDKGTHSHKPAYDSYIANPDEAEGALHRTGNLPVSESQGVHSLQDVPVFASGPGAHLFGRVMDNTEIFFNFAEALGLGQDE
ncbi:alkaline phosphatase-like protein [Basidiobolus meristosporus CBS 931.73]|uniref:alkaline phosphatase n=1 Tax=Basidiobolus meristosporus CBS 931.73 TaxID=1314790 RepID=A0A1Y1YN25_9FUNG|nr:alkaline phosphatase-like protein [Basidiobolus meristosporus CBS 931.73]|eukprot:ORX99243.1 alkaline phosphatase-like protein [Basidiobolus meristosporus CBS 931.73]